MWRLTGMATTVAKQLHCTEKLIARQARCRARCSRHRHGKATASSLPLRTRAIALCKHQEAARYTSRHVLLEFSSLMVPSSQVVNQPLNRLQSLVRMVFACWRTTNSSISSCTCWRSDPVVMSLVAAALGLMNIVRELYRDGG